MRGFELIDGITMADMAFRATGESIEELFHAAAAAMMSVMLENPASIDKIRCMDFTISNRELDLLLFQFLQEFIYYKDADSMLLYPDEIHIGSSSDGFTLKCVACGEMFDRGKHRINTDVKAVTLHGLNVAEENHRWTATVVLDV